MFTLLIYLLRKHKHRIWISSLLLALLFCISLTQALAESPRMNTVLYGASYYHEYMPYDRLEKDVELMQKAGITVVRLGESTWTSWEPREGEFEFAWMQRILDCLHGAGIQVILGTPTYSIPPWLYRKHPQSPVPVAERGAFQLMTWPYAEPLRFDVPVEPPPAAAKGSAGGLAGEPRLPLPVSAGDEVPSSQLGVVRLKFASGERSLNVYWLSGYAGGLFLPFRDTTNGRETYGAGRYVLDGAKNADLGGDLERGTLVVDFNFAYQPSCAFDPRWACPLAPPENRLDIAVEAGERLA